MANRKLGKILEKLNLSSYTVLLGYLKKSGWLRSVRTRSSVNIDCEPMPWYSYAFLYFIEPRISANLVVAEYGSGNSTLWWASRVKKVISVEDDAQWFRKICTALPVNVELRLETGEAYLTTLSTYKGLLDVVIVDGSERAKCLELAVELLSKEGVIILDDADRPEYRQGVTCLFDHGFKVIPFRSLGPISGHPCVTSIFYRDLNCLSI